ncbi:MAG: toll/interleukin-1 receptor domain-containing protein [Promethearchaeia archaeon]
MNVFLSWSGDESKEFARIFSEWLPLIFQNIKIFYSEDDISKGEFWTSRLRQELQTNDTGIIFLTKDNMNNPWILFEAGALTNGIGKGKITPILFDFEIKELNNPLNLFNVAKFQQEDIYKLLKSINKDLGDNGITEKQLETYFNRFWKDINDNISRIQKEYKNTDSAESQPKDQTELIEESLTNQKEIIKYLSQKEAPDYTKHFKSLEEQYIKIRSLIENQMINIESQPDEYTARSRPKTFRCNVMRFSHKKKKWIIFIGLSNHTVPKEIFITPEDDEIIPIPPSVKEGKIVKEKNGKIRLDFQYNDKFGYENTLGGINHLIKSDVVNYTFMLNSILINIYDKEFIFKVIDEINAKGNDNITAWKQGVRKVLDNY